MKRKLAAVLALTLAPILANAAPAHAYTTKQSGCTATYPGATGIHMTATRIFYAPSKTAIYASATQSWKQVKNNAPDVTWTFVSFTSDTGLQSRYSQPTQWGSQANPMLYYAERIKVTWSGTSVGGGRYTTSCTTYAS